MKCKLPVITPYLQEISIIYKFLKASWNEISAGRYVMRLNYSSDTSMTLATLHIRVSVRFQVVKPILQPSAQAFSMPREQRYSFGRLVMKAGDRSYQRNAIIGGYAQVRTRVDSAYHPWDLSHSRAHKWCWRLEMVREDTCPLISISRSNEWIKKNLVISTYRGLPYHLRHRNRKDASTNCSAMETPTASAHTRKLRYMLKAR